MWDMATFPDAGSLDATGSSNVMLDAILDASPLLRLENVTQQTPLGTVSSTSQTVMHNHDKNYSFFFCYL